MAAFTSSQANRRVNLSDANGWRARFHYTLAIPEEFRQRYANLRVVQISDSPRIQVSDSELQCFGSIYFSAGVHGIK